MFYVVNVPVGMPLGKRLTTRVAIIKGSQPARKPTMKTRREWGVRMGMDGERAKTLIGFNHRLMNIVKKQKTLCEGMADKTESTQ